MFDPLERVEQYLSGEMSAGEKLQFEQEMRDDPQLQNTVDRFRLVQSALDVSAEDDLRNRLREIEAQSATSQVTTNESSVRRLYPRIAMAAGILLLISAGLWVVFHSSSSGLQKFAEENYLSYDYQHLRGEQTDIRNFPFDPAAIKIDPNQALQWTESWVAQHPADDEARFMLADLFKISNQIDDARIQLNMIIEHGSVLWSEKAEWNYVLISVGQHWDDRAQILLDRMKNNPAHSFHPQALQLDQRMKK